MLNFFKDFKFYENKNRFTETDIENLLALIPESFDYTWDNGFTKLVIIPKEGDFVYKIPFTGYDEKGRYHKATCDYCKEEENIYNHAKLEGFSNFFAEVKFIKDFENGIKVYSQPKCTTQEDYNFSSSCAIDEYTASDYVLSAIKKNSRVKKKIRKIINQFSHIWVWNCFKAFGFDNTIKFFEWMYYNCYNSDVDIANYGYWDKFQESPCLIDYGGCYD